MAGTSHFALLVADALRQRFDGVADVVLLRGGARIVVAVEYRGTQRTFECAAGRQELASSMTTLTREIVLWMATIVKGLPTA